MSQSFSQQRTYEAEFKRDAVQLVADKVRSYTDVAEALGIPVGRSKTGLKHTRSIKSIHSLGKVNYIQRMKNFIICDAKSVVARCRFCGVISEFLSPREMMIAVGRYIHDYNTIRPHASLGGLTPEAFHRNHSPSQAA